MKIVLISDTHSKHKRLGELPEGDMIIHAGDVSGRGYFKEVEAFCEWYRNLNFKYKILIAGNHDFYFEHNDHSMIEHQLKPIVVNPAVVTEGMPIIYLHDSMVEIEGIKIWGSPYTPEFYNWAFMKKRGKELEDHWKKIPYGMDIVITHGPPKGILDECPEHVGDEDHLNRILEVRPKYNVFGHIHEGYGIYKGIHTTFINASVLDREYMCVNDPIVIDL